MRSARYSLLAAVLLLGGLMLASCTKTQVAQKPEATTAAPAPLEASAPPPTAQLLTTTTSASANSPAGSSQPADIIARIRDEGMNRSQVMQTLSYLTDVIGPRLTGSPNLKRANEWTRDKLKTWGLVNSHLEAWGPFGRGWSLHRFSAQIVEPQDIPLIAFPKAWSPGFEKPVTADVVYLDAKVPSDLDRFKGKLKGAIVLFSPVREVQPRFDPLAVRVDDAELLKLANSDTGNPPPPGIARANTAAERRELLAPRGGPRELLTPGTPLPATRPTSRPTSRPADRPFNLARMMPQFCAAEGVLMLVTPSTQGDGGTFFIAQASMPTTQPFQGGFRQNNPQPWSADAPPIIPQMTVAVEHYNRLVRMIEQGEKLKMAVDLQAQYHTADLMAYNTIAEIPGSDLKDQIVMIGAHMDSWHSGTGATDNGAGVASVMEAVRIIKALKLQPRRTIRIALWTGEEEGIFGSKAYVSQHFGKFEDSTTRPATRPALASTTRPVLNDQLPATGPATRRSATRPAPRTARKFIPGPEYHLLSAYFNLDNGAGKIRGIYLQGNEAARPIFRQWLAPFVDLGAQTITLANTTGTDHLSFDAIGLPGFQFIQDPLDYWTRTHHSNQDVYDRVPPDDLKQASTILAAFIYNAAMADEKIPRKHVAGIE